MKLHIKTVIIVLVLLGLGFAIGMLTSGMLFQKKVKNMVKNQMPGGFERHMISTLDLTEVQQKEIKPFLEAHAEQKKEIFREPRMKHRARMDSLVQQISPLLEQEQQVKLEETINDMKRRKRQRDKKGPGPKRPVSQ